MAVKAKAAGSMPAGSGGAREETVYTLNDFVAAHKRIGYPQEVIIAAFNSAGLSEASEARAITVINSFLKGEVK